MKSQEFEEGFVWHPARTLVTPRSCAVLREGNGLSRISQAWNNGNLC